MGRRGAKPQPTALKIARGNPGKRPLNELEPDLPPASLEPPAGMPGRALREWEKLGPVLTASGVLTVADLKCFETYCRLVDDEERYVAMCEKVGDAAAFQVGYAGQLLKIRAQLKQYMAELGGTPSSRSGVKAKKPTDPADERRKRFFGIKGGAQGGGSA